MMTVNDAACGGAAVQRSPASVASVAAAVALGTALALASCGGSDAGESTLTVDMSEWVFTQSATSVASGDVTFTVHNVGGAEHELVVLKGVDLAALAIKPDGTVDEDKIAEAAKMGEVEGVAAQTDKSATLALTPGSYTLLCNLIEPNGDSHFAKGMHGTLTVT
jgi:plastocyanin